MTHRDESHKVYVVTKCPFCHTIIKERQVRTRDVMMIIPYVLQSEPETPQGGGVGSRVSYLQPLICLTIPTP